MIEVEKFYFNGFDNGGKFGHYLLAGKTMAGQLFGFKILLFRKWFVLLFVILSAAKHLGV
ncbi:hypothetical protein [Paracnuella aquatica]|uniref:hypothetical protein n=1 Tax=Paracnuella aquatica TaxID=2268757 RepID=UPI000DEF517C|nr:hypothetical protein [Paracnuella aquatica]RPD44477.1 hypothetical protein DRJ53_17335 [Paracnuella aquatica]